ncbi:MAG: hypothetical protein R2695_08845 [Acidimicrobiales bacterium]
MWAMQEAYPGQIRWIARHALSPPDWQVTGPGRNRTGRGEAVPLWHRVREMQLMGATTRWFGPTPDVPGSRIEGAQFPRIVTIADYEWAGAAGDSGSRTCTSMVGGGATGIPA